MILNTVVETMTQSEKKELENARKLGIDLSEIEYIVLSHGHYDHTWGLKHLLYKYRSANTIPTAKSALLAHPLSFNHRTKDANEMGCNIAEAELIDFFSIHKSRKPVWITDKLVFLGEIKRNFSYEGNHCRNDISISIRFLRLINM